MDIGGAIKGAILDMIPGDAARKIPNAMAGTTTGTTSGLDAAMQAHANQVHPLSPAAQKYKLRLPSDE